MSRTILIAGATGEIGKVVLELALADPRVDRVIAPVRRPLPEHGKLEQWVGPDLEKTLKEERPNAVICCLGTTMRAVGGDKSSFVHVDQELVLALGRWASGPAMRFSVVSSFGAHERSMFFYNRVKGTMEAGLRGMDFEALEIFRPSILEGDRQESRPGERVGLGLMKVLAPVLPAPYRPMPYRILAQALLNAAVGNDIGVHVHSYRGITKLALRPAQYNGAETRS